MNPITPSQKMERALTVLVTENPFYGSLALGLRAEPSEAFETMATDGERLLWNPAFVERTPDSHLRTFLAHEVTHCACLHQTRQGDRDHEDWNRACDYEINPMLQQAGFAMPRGALISDEYRGMTAEAIYEALRRDRDDAPPPQGGAGAGAGQDDAQGSSGSGQDGAGGSTGAQGGATPTSGSPSGPGQGNQGAPTPDPGGMGAVIPAAGGDPNKQDENAAKWETQVRVAAAIAKAQNAGEYPAELERMVEQLNDPEVSWREILRRFYDQSTITRSSWSRPNKRHLWRGFILPGQVPDGLNRLVLAVDTSGSFDEECMEQARAEVQQAFDEGGVDRVTIVYCDAAIQGEPVTFERGQILEFEPKGGGGTKFSPVMDWIAAEARDAAALIYLTDLQVHDFGEDPGIPVLWGYVGDPRRYEHLAGRVPFGQAIQVTAD